MIGVKAVAFGSILSVFLCIVALTLIAGSVPLVLCADVITIYFSC